MKKKSVLHLDSYVRVSGSFVGYHRYVHAPDEVKYLRQPHRHVFGVKLTVEVSHDDREIEYHLLKQDLGSACAVVSKLMAVDKESTLSCEQIAHLIVNTLYGMKKRKVPHLFISKEQEAEEGKIRQITVEVSEDGECSSLVTFRNIASEE